MKEGNQLEDKKFTLYSKVIELEQPAQALMDFSTNENNDVFNILNASNKVLSHAGIIFQIKSNEGNEMRNENVRLVPCEIWQYIEEQKSYVGIIYIGLLLGQPLHVLVCLKERE